MEEAHPLLSGRLTISLPSASVVGAPDGKVVSRPFKNARRRLLFSNPQRDLGISTFDRCQTMPNRWGTKRLRLLPWCRHSAYSGTRH